MPDPSPQVFGGEWPYAVTEFKSQLIAVGSINGGCCTGGYTTDTRAVVWQAKDRRTWTLEPHRDAFALGRMQAVATNGSLLLAAGALNVESRQSPGEVAPIGATWVSRDGESWTRTTGMPIFYGLAWFGDQFYGITERAPTSSSVWASRDGRHWTHVQELPGDGLTILRATPAGLIAAGVRTEPPASGLALWLSPDGSAWTRQSLPSGAQDVLRDAAGNASVVVAIGQSESGAATVWTSRNHGPWIKDDHILGPGGSLQLEVVLWTGEVFAMFGEGDAGGSAIGPRILTSADGAGWSLVPPEGAAFAVSGEVTGAAVLHDGQLVLVGAGEGSGGHHGVPLSWSAAP